MSESGHSAAHSFWGSQSNHRVRRALLRDCDLVRKGGFEPPRLSAPPPQDGVSASSTTSARGNCHAIDKLKRSALEGVFHCSGFCTDLLHSTRVSSSAKSPTAGPTISASMLAWVKTTYGHLNVSVSRHGLQCCSLTGGNATSFSSKTIARSRFCIAAETLDGSVRTWAIKRATALLS